jgi:hypothetical protein
MADFPSDAEDGDDGDDDDPDLLDELAGLGGDDEDGTKNKDSCVRVYKTVFQFRFNIIVKSESFLIFQRI